MKKESATYLLVHIGKHDFALPAESVRQLVPHARVSPFPHGPAWCAGLLEIGHQAVPALAMRQFLRMPGAKPPSAAVVVERAPEAEFPLLALLVDRLTITETIPLHQLMPIRPGSSLPFRDYISFAWRARSRACYVLNLESLPSENRLAFAENSES